MSHPSRLSVQFLLSWHSGVKAKCKIHKKLGNRQGDAQEGGGAAMRGHISINFSVSFALPQFTSCAGEKG